MLKYSFHEINTTPNIFFVHMSLESYICVAGKLSGQTHCSMNVKPENVFSTSLLAPSLLLACDFLLIFSLATRSGPVSGSLQRDYKT